MRWRLIAAAGVLALWGGVARGGPAPDLVMTVVDGPSRADAGQTITVDNTVENQGDLNANAFSVGIYLSTDANITTGDVELDQRLVSSLDIGLDDEASTQVTIPADTLDGDYYIGAYADINDEAGESGGGKGNNDLADAGGIRIGPPPTPFDGGCSPGCESAAWLVPLALSLAGLRRRRRAGKARG